MAEKMADSVLLIFIPNFAHGHIAATIQLANTLFRRDNRFKPAILIINPPFSDPDYSKKLSASNPEITFIDIPRVDPSALTSKTITTITFMSFHIEGHKKKVLEAVGKLVDSGQFKSTRFILDMFATSMIDVAEHFSSPAYIFFTSSASFLGFTQFSLNWNQSKFDLSGPDLLVPTYASPVPSSVLPTHSLSEDGHSVFVQHAKRIRKIRGVIVNSFGELEPHALGELSKDEEFPPVYAVGPILDLPGMNQVLNGRRAVDKDRIFEWLDEQEEESVVLLCFGSEGFFGAGQVNEIAIALERTGVRFLWSVRKSQEGPFEAPKDYEGPDDPILPAGFRSRIGTQGFICGWAPQVEILGHKAIGGFVTHCGWNSTLESIWFGIPTVTWPLHSEQQLDAFDIVKNLGFGICLTMDYRRGQQEVLKAEEIERAIKCLMDRDGRGGEVRKKVKEMAGKSKAAVAAGGSSFRALGQLINDMLH